MSSVSVDTAISFGKKTARVYAPRIIHVDWKTIHTLIGVASHFAWRELAKKGKTLRVDFNQHKKLTGELMKKWCWELIEKQLG